MEVKAKIREFMKTSLKDNGFKNEISDNDSLIELGVMDSLAILTLISFLDEEFAIIPGDDELYPENFETIITISDFISKKLGDSA